MFPQDKMFYSCRLCYPNRPSLAPNVSCESYGQLRVQSERERTTFLTADGQPGSRVPAQLVAGGQHIHSTASVLRHSVSDNQWHQWDTSSDIVNTLAHVSITHVSLQGNVPTCPVTISLSLSAEPHAVVWIIVRAVTVARSVADFSKYFSRSSSISPRLCSRHGRDKNMPRIGDMCQLNVNWPSHQDLYWIRQAAQQEQLIISN